MDRLIKREEEEEEESQLHPFQSLSLSFCFLFFWLENDGERMGERKETALITNDVSPTTDRGVSMQK